MVVLLRMVMEFCCAVKRGCPQVKRDGDNANPQSTTYVEPWKISMCSQSLDCLKSTCHPTFKISFAIVFKYLAMVMIREVPRGAHGKLFAIKVVPRYFTFTLSFRERT